MAENNKIECFVIECGEKYKCKKPYSDEEAGLTLVEGQEYEVEEIVGNMICILEKFSLSRLFFWEHFTELPRQQKA